MTAENKRNLVKYVQAMVVDGGTNMNDGVQMAFDVFQATTRSSGCMKLLLFLTDGENSQSDADLHRLTAAENVEVGARIFTFTFGAKTGLQTMTKVACDHRGVSRYIPDGGDLKEAMASYYLRVIHFH
jgi:Mg-chelatase subunit ChlD